MVESSGFRPSSQETYQFVKKSIWRRAHNQINRMEDRQMDRQREKRVDGGREGNVEKTHLASDIIKYTRRGQKNRQYHKRFHG